MTSTLEDVNILIADHKFTQVKELLPILNQCSSENKSLLIIADDIDSEALATLIVNKMRGTLKVCAVKSPEFGDRKKLILEDIATLTGGEVFTKDKGMKLDRFDTSWFGGARVATIGKDKTTIIDGKGDAEAINQRVEELSQQIEKAETPFEIERLQDRLSKFVGGVAIVHVGGNTELEMQEKKDRVDDALHATKAALEEGVVAGGGRALLYSLSVLPALENGNPDYNYGLKIVQQACKKPFEQILTNAGKTDTEAQILSYEFEDNKNPWSGYNIKTEKETDMKESGIIDPLKVTRNALQNASSVAGTILLTEAVVVDNPEDDKSSDIDPAAMMGMM
jgi:chaperonin GroEL